MGMLRGFLGEPLEPLLGCGGLPPKPTPGFTSWLAFPGAEGAEFRVCPFPKGEDGAGPCLPLKHLNEELAAPSALGRVGLAGFGSPKTRELPGGGWGWNSCGSKASIPTMEPGGATSRAGTLYPPEDTGDTQGDTGRTQGCTRGKRNSNFRAGSPRVAGGTSCRNGAGWGRATQGRASTAPNLLDCPEKLKPGASGMR